MESFLRAGLERAERVAEKNPSHHEVVVTHAELLAEKARARNDLSSLDEALRQLERALELPGCGNRVSLLTAEALLLKSVFLEKRGEDPRELLRQVLLYREQLSEAIAHTPAWKPILQRAEGELARLSAGE